MRLLVYHIQGKIIEGIPFTRNGSPFNAATYENQLNWPINLMNILFPKCSKIDTFSFCLKIFNSVNRCCEQKIGMKLRIKFSLIRVRIWQKDPLVTSLALAETWLWRMASSGVERHIAMAEIVDLTGSCLHWGERLEHWSYICGIVDDVGHNSLLVFITGIIVV